MADAEILTKAIQITADNGWEEAKRITVDDGPYLHLHWYSQDTSTNDLLFNHNFAKALWGDKNYMAYQFHTTLARQPEDLNESGIYPIWKWHMIRMVASIDPIAYLGEHI